MIDCCSGTDCVLLNVFRRFVLSLSQDGCALFDFCLLTLVLSDRLSILTTGLPALKDISVSVIRLLSYVGLVFIFREGFIYLRQN